MSEGKRQSPRHPKGVVEFLHDVEVGMADAGAANPYHHLTGPRLGIVDLDDHRV
jgi:hypothetical protein